MGSSSYTDPNVNREEKRKLEIVVIGAVLLVAVLLILVIGFDYLSKIKFDKKADTPKVNLSQDATPRQVQKYNSYIKENKFEGPSTLSGSTTINGVLAGYSGSSIKIITSLGSQLFNISPATPFYTQKLVTDGQGNQVFSKSAIYLFSSFKQRVPLGTIVQVIYTPDTTGTPVVKQVETYIDQKAE